MPVPAFGFSVGDFLAGIKLVKDLIDSLDEVSGAKPHFRRLVAELRNLERALTEVKALQVDASQIPQKLALEQVASQCQDCIEEFLKRNTKIHEGLASHAVVSTLRASVRKFQWAVCRQDAVDKFRTEIMGHALTINTLMVTIQIAYTSLQNKTSAQHHKESNETRSLVQKNNEILNSHADLMVTISRAITSCATQEQTHDLRVIMQKVLETNMKIFQLILEMQRVQQTQIPLQVDRQQPVYFEDAHGRIAPFHTEFINSLEAFQAVMEVRFRHVPGLRKVQEYQYIVKESNSKRKLNLRAPWESVFLPGRKVVMSMVFQMLQTITTSCPGCQSVQAVSSDEFQGEIQCANTNCGLWYERISEIDENATSHESRRSRKRPASDAPKSAAKRTRLDYGHEKRYFDHQRDLSSADSDDEDTVQQFKRVQVVLKQQSKLRVIRNRRERGSIKESVILEDPLSRISPFHLPILTSWLKGVRATFQPQAKPSDEQVKLQDPLGRVGSLPLKFVNSWDSFNTILKMRFLDLPEHHKTIQKRYILKDRATGRAIGHSQSCEDAFLSGQCAVTS